MLRRQMHYSIITLYHLHADPSGREVYGDRSFAEWVRIPLGAWMSVCCECCVLTGRGLCDEHFARPEESNRRWCVVVCRSPS